MPTQSFSKSSMSRCRRWSDKRWWCLCTPPTQTQYLWAVPWLGTVVNTSHVTTQNHGRSCLLPWKCSHSHSIKPQNPQSKSEGADENICVQTKKQFGVVSNKMTVKAHSTYYSTTSNSAKPLWRLISGGTHMIGGSGMVVLGYSTLSSVGGTSLQPLRSM